MLKIVRSVETLDGYRVRLTFADGVEKVVDLGPKLRGEVFEPVLDPGYFRRVFVENGTIRWPNGADFDPEVLYYGGPPPWARSCRTERKDRKGSRKKLSPARRSCR